MQKIIKNHLKELGVPASLIGYHYQACAIGMLIEDMSLINAITKTIYPKVAKEFNTTLYAVERAIRTAITIGWERGNVDFQKKLFGYTVSANKGTPTNSEFLVTIADYIIMCENDG